MSNTTTEDTRELKLLKLPENRFITSYSVAYNIVKAACDSHQGYWDIIDACNKHIEGQKPVSQKDLNERGLGWVWNFNYGKALAKIQKSVAEAVSATSSSLSMGYVTFRIKNDDDVKDDILNFLGSEEKRGIVASVIGAALSHALSCETRLSGWLNEVEYPSFCYGYCALVFDKFDWMPSPVHPSKIGFRPNTRPESINQFVTFKIMEAEDLYKRWVTARNERTENSFMEDGQTKRISSSGWSVEGLEAILIRAFKGRIGTENKTPTRWSEVIPYFESNPSSIISNTSSVTIAKIFHKELDGTITECYIPWGSDWSPSTGGSNVSISSDLDVDNIIYLKNHGKYVQENHIGLVRDSAFTTESGFIQEYRGIAKFAVDDSIRYNRTRNGIGNKMQFVGSPMFESPSTTTSDKFKITVSQGFIMLPSGHNLVEKQPSFDINSHIAVLGFEEGQYLRDTQQYDASIQGRLTSRPNRGEVQRVTEEVEFTNSAKRVVKMRDYASIFRAVIRRMPSVKCKESDVGYEGKKRFYDYVKKNLQWLVKSDDDVDKIISAIDGFIMDPVATNVDVITMAMQMAETPFPSRNPLRTLPASP